MSGNMSSNLENMARAMVNNTAVLERIATALEGTPSDERLQQVEDYANGLPESLGIIKQDLLAIVDGTYEPPPGGE